MLPKRGARFLEFPELLAFNNPCNHGDNPGEKHGRIEALSKFGMPPLPSMTLNLFLDFYNCRGEAPDKLDAGRTA